MTSSFHNERNISFCRAEEPFADHNKTFILCFGNKLIWKFVLLGSGLGMTQCSLPIGVGRKGGTRSLKYGERQDPQTPFSLTELTC